MLSTLQSLGLALIPPAAGAGVVAVLFMDREESCQKNTEAQQL